MASDPGIDAAERALRYGQERLRVRVWIVAVVVCAGGFVAPARSLAVGWGINLDGLVVPGNAPSFTFQSNPYFTELLGGSSCADATSTAICFASLYVPWDAVNDGKGSFSAGTCQKSPAGPGSQAAVYEDDVAAAARAVGVGHVLVDLTTSLNTSHDAIWPTDSEYECGLSGLERAEPGVTQWETFNEPDSAYVPDSIPGGGPNCTARNGVWVAAQEQCVLGSPAVHPPGGNGHGGSAQAAAYWYLDAKRVDPSTNYTIVAGGFNFNTSSCLTSKCYYLSGYFRELSRIYGPPPDAISLHPYLDVDYAALNGGDPLPPATSGLPSAQGAIVDIDAIYPSDPQIWMTEAGVWLTYSGKAQVTSVCGDGIPADDGTWLACLNGNPTAQALAAEGYLRLPTESSQITRLYYYDFNGQNGGWDSGLVNDNPGLLGSSGYGTPRMAWCVLHNFADGESPTVAEMNAVRPGSTCDDQNPHDATYAPVVAQHFIAGAGPAPLVVAEQPGEVGREFVLTVADGVQTLLGTLVPGTTG
jgi:hypothetical protein